jgi:hypothetical protein
VKQKKKKEKEKDRGKEKVREVVTSAIDKDILWLQISVDYT